jgi:hypothetical protein
MNKVIRNLSLLFVFGISATFLPNALHGESVPSNATLLRPYTKKELKKTHLFILLSSFRQGKFADALVECMEANARRLEQFGAKMTIAVRCDGERGDNDETVLSKDIRDYAEALNAAGIAFKVRASERVKPSEFVYSYHKPDEAHWELVANEKNLGCSGSRHASIDAIEKEVKELCAKGERVYVGIFDGDDFIHPDFYLLLTANAIRTGATVSNYNGKIGAHGLQKTSLFMPYDESFFGSTAKKKTYWLYQGKNNFGQNDLDASREKELGEARRSISSSSGICCTTKIFEAKYFYDRLDALVKQRSNGNRHAIDLLTLTLLDGFNDKACTCATEKSLFFYNEKGRLEDLWKLRYKEPESLEKESKEPDYRSYFKVQ